MVLQDILHHIHSLLYVQDAARLACVSRVFLRSWRCYSNLILDDDILGLTDNKLEDKEIKMINKVDKILEHHHDNVVKVKTLSLDLNRYKNINFSYLDRWLQISVKSGIEELNLMLSPFMDECYSFPCSVLSDMVAASSIQSIFLMYCTFHSTSALAA